MRRFLVHLVVASALSACAAPSASAPTPVLPAASPAPAPRPASPQSTAETDDAAELVVTAPGAEPRAPRKYAFVANRSDKRVLTIRQLAGREGGGPPQEAAFAVTADFVPKVINPKGTKFEMKVLKVDVPDMPAAARAQAAAELAAFTGLTGSFDVTARGEVGEVDFKAAEKIDPNAEVIIQSLQQALELLLPPFPDAPIGAGAKWERKIVHKERGNETSTKHTFTLAEVSADGGVVTADVEISVPKHPFRAKGVPRGATEDVKGTGSYTYAFKFDHVSTKLSGEITITRRIEVPDGNGGNQAIAETVKLKNQLDTK